MEDVLNKFRKIVKYTQRISGEEASKLGINPEKLSKKEEIIPESKVVFSVEMRTDPLLGEYSDYTSLISEERANRPGLPNNQKRTEENKDCIFCKPKSYYALSVPAVNHREVDVISVPNRFPSIIPHYVTIFSNKHKTDLAEIDFDDMFNYLRSGKDLAMEFASQGLEGMIDYINWGVDAGGTQPHAHSQRQGIYAGTRGEADKEIKAIENRAIDLGMNPFDWYMSKVRDSGLFVFEDKEIFISAPFAPKFNNQIDIVTKNSKNYLDMDEKTMFAIAGGMALVLSTMRRFSYEHNGEVIPAEITNINVVNHQTRFAHSSQNYRMHWHIYPRMSRIGGTELQGFYGISLYPEETARALRNVFIAKTSA
jgi:galactose-1-phosphate uridylyltransferase